MFPSGIFVRTEFDDLIASFPDRLVYSGPSRLTVEMEPNDPGLEGHATLRVNEWPNNWCLVETTGPEALTGLVIESLIGKDPFGEVLSCHFKPEASEFSYTLFRDGVLLETFESSGSSSETVNFISEIRKVPLKDLLRASDFMAKSLSQHGVDPGLMPVVGTRNVVIRVNFPAKRTFWQALLGAVSSR